MRILGVDLGDKRIGLAISDPLGFTAQGLKTLERKKGVDELNTIKLLCEERGVEECVIGLPLRLNGEIGERAKIVMAWVQDLEKRIPCPVRTWDERLTSREAQRLMIQQDLSRRKQKSRSDELSAILILQNYLEYRRSVSASEQEYDTDV